MGVSCVRVALSTSATKVVRVLCRVMAEDMVDLKMEHACEVCVTELCDVPFYFRC